VTQRLNREQDINEAMATASRCRLLASQLAQCRMFPAYVAWLLTNARAAERWASRSAHTCRRVSAPGAHEPIARFRMHNE
jgi:hypothetical protein